MFDYLEQINNDDAVNQIEASIEEAYDKLSVAITTAEVLENATVNGVMSNENFKIITTMVDYDLSTEDNPLATFKTNLNALYKNLNGYIFKQFKGFSPIVNKAKEYNIAGLSKLKDDIKSGKLVPKTKVDQDKVKSLNSKLGPFYASGYSLVKGCGDLTTFMNGMVSISDKKGKYMKGLYNMFTKLNAPTPELNIPMLSGLLNTKKKLIGLKDTVSRKQMITDFRLSIITNYIASNVVILFVSNSTKRGIRVHTDMYTINTDKVIGTADTASTIKMLDNAISIGGKLDTIYSGIKLNIKFLTRDNTLQLISSITGENATHRFLVAKYSEAVTKSLISLYSNIINSDKLVMDYIRLTYEKQK